MDSDTATLERLNPATAPPLPPKPLAAPITETSGLPPPEAQDERLTEDKYGGRLYFLGMIFCVVIVASVIVVSIYANQSSNQSQKTVVVNQP